MSDVLKMVEDALEMACGTFRSHAGEERRAEECAAALTALRGLEWRPIAEAPHNAPRNGVVFGKWVAGKEVTEIAWSREYAIRRGYTHFCSPILPTPPKREVENVG